MADIISPIVTGGFDFEKTDISSPTGTFDSTFTLDDLLRSGLHTPITPFTPFSPKHKEAEAALDTIESEDDEVPPAYAATPNKGKEVLLAPAVFSTDVKPDVKVDTNRPDKPDPKPELVRFRGNSYTITQLEAMRSQLNLAIKNDELPQYDTLSLEVQHILDDYTRLSDMRLVRGGQSISSWETDSAQRSLRISFAANLQSRSQAMRRDLAEANTKTRVESMVQNTSSDARFYGLIQHAIKDAVKNQAIDGRHGVNESNMDAVLEELFGIIEAGFLDAAGPLRLNNNLLSQNNNTLNQNNQVLTETSTAMNQTSTAMNQTSTAMNQTSTAMNQTSTAMHQQVNAISHHVGAIRSHVSALGSHFGAMDNNLSSVSNNVSTLGTQINMLQTVVNLVPNMVQQSIKETLKQTLDQDALKQVLKPVLEAQMKQILAGTSAAVASTTTISAPVSVPNHNDVPTSPRKSKRRCFFFRSRKDHY